MGAENSQVCLTHSLGGSRGALLGDGTGEGPRGAHRGEDGVAGPWDPGVKRGPWESQPQWLSLAESLGCHLVKQLTLRNAAPHERPGWRDLFSRTEKASRCLASRIKTP